MNNRLERLKKMPFATVDEIMESIQAYRDFLVFHSKFYKYNLQDALMIYAQAPKATAVATYEQWKAPQIGRGVRKGAFPIGLLRGDTYENVFDLKHTYGQEFRYQSSYHFTEEEKEKYFSWIQRDERDIDNKIISFIGAESIQEMNKLYENEKVREKIKDYADLLYHSMYQMIMNRYHIEADISFPEDEFRAIQQLPAEEKIGILRYIQEASKPIILNIDKQIRQIQTKERAGTYEISEFKQAGSGKDRLSDAERKQGIMPFDRRGVFDRADLRGSGNQPRQMGLDMGELDERQSPGTDGRTDERHDIRRDRNPNQSGSGGVSGNAGEQLAGEEPQTDQRELSRTTEIRNIGEDVRRELSDDGRTGEGLPRRINPNKIQEEKITGIKRLPASVKWEENLTAISVMKELEKTGRTPNIEDINKLEKFSGFGSLPQVFDNHNEQWAERRNQLKSLLTKEEYDSLEESTLSAHFTSDEIVKAIYEGIEGFGVYGGKILEPSMGNGAFFRDMPTELKNKSELYGVELNSITGRIAQKLYPEAKIEVKGFEETDFQDNFFDAAIGNIPFGQFKVYDPKYNSMNLLIHDYFFVKALDKVKPNGIIAFITSKGTMDKENTKVRRYLAERAELLGAVRLPNDAFAASSGAVKVTTDILFLRKRERPISAENEPWVHTNLNKDGFPINEYFIENPEMVLGEIQIVKLQYGRDDIACVSDGRDLPAAIKEAIKNLHTQHTPPEEIFEQPLSETTAKELPTCIEANPEIKNFCYAVIDDKVYYRENEQMLSDEKWTGKKEERIKALVELREKTTDLLKEQLRTDISEEQIKALQNNLSETYDAFVKKHGKVNDKANVAAFRQDTDFPLVSSLEVILENGKTKKADIFSKRTLTPYSTPTYCESAQEAYTVCLNEKRRVDLEYIAQLTGQSQDDVKNDLKGLIYQNPTTEEWEQSDEYLSGNVVEKLAIAQAAAEQNSDYEQNVEALTAVQPIPLEAHEISVNIGAPWIEPMYYTEFMKEKFMPHAWEKYEVQYNNVLNTWFVQKPQSRHTKLEAQSVYGTGRMDAYVLLENLLNQRSLKVYDYYQDAEGRDRRTLNKEETIAVRNKAEYLREEFAEWLFSKPERRDELTKLYNKRYNSERIREYDGSFLRYQGMNEAIQLKPHQNNAVARILFGGNTLLAHTVGAGKTFVMTAAAMEMRRMGMAKKPMIIVPNHLVEQWANEFKQLYPLANILAARKEDFEKTNRQKFCGRIATGDWDAVIMGHSSFEKIPVSRELEEKNLQKQIDTVKSALTDTDTAQNPWLRQKDPIGVKQLRTTLKNLEVALKELRNKPRDNVITFEQLGVDALFVDEAHSYKNKFLYSKMQNIAGIQKTGSKKSTDLELKCDYINERCGGERNVVFATGTPVSNSMVELYTMQSYLQKSVLKQKGIDFFDNWAALFGKVQSVLEIAPSGQSFRMRERFCRFMGLPELMNDFRKIADIQTKDMLNLPIPSIKGGKPETIQIEPSAGQKGFVQFLSDISDKINEGKVAAESYNMLCVTGDGRLGALDMRAVNVEKLKELGEYYGIDTDGIVVDGAGQGKISACAEKVAKIYHDTTPEKSTQLVFCDIATPSAGGRFDAYQALKDTLEQKGVDPKEVAFIHDAKNDKQKQDLFQKVQTGAVRILIGSTAKMGAGTNVQTKLIALHHLDCPWRPSDLEQREGRIVRQGNQNKEVQIYNYVTKGTFDAYLWQIVESKQKFISQIMTSKTPARVMEDMDTIALNYAEVKACCIDNPKIRRKTELEIDLQRLRVLESQYTKEKYSLQDKVLKYYPGEIARYERRIECLEKDIARRNDNRIQNGTEAAFSMIVMGKLFTDRKEAGEELLKQASFYMNKGQAIAQYMGMELMPQQDRLDLPKLHLCGATTTRLDISESPIGMVTKIENAMKNLDHTLEQAQVGLQTTKEQLIIAKDKLKQPFSNAAELRDVTEELNQINLDISKESADGIVEEVEITAEKTMEMER